MDATFSMTAIGVVRGGRSAATDDDWGASRAAIMLADGFAADALAGIADFSHAEIIFLFDQVASEKIETGARGRAPTGAD